MALQPFAGPWELFQFLNPIYSRYDSLEGGSVRRKATTYTHTTTQTQNKRTQTSVPRMGFEHTVPPFKREKRAHALDRAATVIGK
jgi:hypothetical protein